MLKHVPRAPVDWEPFEPGDLPAALRLLEQMEPRHRYSSECLARVIFDDPEFDQALSCKLRAPPRVWFPPGERELQSFGIAVLRRAEIGNPRAAQNERTGFIKLIAMAPHAMGAGSGFALCGGLRCVLELSGASRIYYDGATPAYFRPGLEAGDATRREILDYLGFRAIDERHSLVAPLAGRDLDTTAGEARLSAAGYVIRRAGPDDAEFLACQIGSEFSPEWAFEARLALRGSPPGLHVALKDGRLAAFAACGVCGPDVFGPMGTVREHRGKGLGGILLFRCFADLRRAGERSALIQWIGPQEFYRRLLGPLELRRYLVMEKVLA